MSHITKQVAQKALSNLASICTIAGGGSDQDLAKAINDFKDAWPFVAAFIAAQPDDQGFTSQEDARRQILSDTEAIMKGYLLDYCPDDVNWEDFDPDIDSIQTQVGELASR